MGKKYTYVIELNFFMILEKNSIKVSNMLSFVIYSIIEKYVCVEYLCFHYRTLCVISYEKIFKQAIYNGFLGIGIPGVLMNLVYCHGFV